jgi:hypothetical protein
MIIHAFKQTDIVLLIVVMLESSMTGGKCKIRRKEDSYFSVLNNAYLTNPLVFVYYYYQSKECLLSPTTIIKGN